MSPGIHQRVRELFDQTLDQPEGERAPFLEAARAAEPEVVAAVESLLDARRSSGGFLERIPPSRKLGRYLITSELGRGAMGIVYSAVDPMIGRKVALKVIRIESSADASAGFLKERLFQEAHSIGRLSHPGIVVVFDVGQDGGVAFIAMELVEGQSLQQLLASRHGPSRTEALEILRQAGAALDYAHRSGIVHRDIKPANIMLHNSGMVKIADFGIAKIAAPLNQTASGITLGTPTYMSPEQIGMGKVDARSDQFSLGVVAYEMLVGTRPFQSDSLPILAHQIVYADCPSAHAAAPSLALPADFVFRKVLAKRPEDRYRSCLEFVEALAEALQPRPALQPQLAGRHPVGAVPRPARKIGYAAGALAAVAILSATMWHYRAASVTNLPRPAQPPPVAIAPAASASSASVGIATPPSTPAPGANAQEPITRPSKDLTAAVVREKSGVNQKAEDPAQRAKRFYAQGLGKREQGQVQEALSLFRQAADLGDPRAMVAVGEAALEGESQQDKDEALRWFRKAAAAGDTVAMLALGVMYHLGDGIPEDYDLAVSWYQRAAAGGNPSAMYNLGRMYETGSGVARNVAKAQDLYRRAAELGNASARSRLSQVAPGAK
jgi:serine/threonine protein kinase